MQIKISPQSWLQVLFYNRAIASLQSDMLKKSNRDKLDTLRKMVEHWETERNNLLVSVEESNTREEVEIY